MLPTFLDESKLTLERLEKFAIDTDPLITQLRPSARALSGTLQQTAKAAPDLIRFFNGLVPVNKKARAVFSALRTVLDDQLPPPLARVDSYLDELIPIVQALDRYKGETTAVLGNLSAATNAFNIDAGGFDTRKYIRTLSPGNIESLATLPERATSNRTNAYVKAGGYTKLAKGLDSFLTAQCGSGLDNVEVTEGAPGDLPPEFFNLVKRYAYGGGTNSSGIPAPRCSLQPGSKSIGGAPHQTTTYPHVRSQNP